MPGPCRPIELSIPLGVSAMRGRGAAEPGVAHHRFGDDGAELGDIEEGVQLAARRGAARGGEDRVRELDARQRRRQVDGRPPLRFNLVDPGDGIGRGFGARLRLISGPRKWSGSGDGDGADD